ncbi:Fructokinase-2 [Apostasia shenzhenica]|uniref:Fructokinase-2 n=1 Tax=Apostasia shenzhenica TaxID=1088818 RepID=A0A2I0BAW1_9ASPA|nr:Fructokinase-2 [Apostasia shenzhenica]
MWFCGVSYAGGAACGLQLHALCVPDRSGRVTPAATVAAPCSIMGKRSSMWLPNRCWLYALSVVRPEHQGSLGCQRCVGPFSEYLRLKLKRRCMHVISKSSTVQEQQTSMAKDGEDGEDAPSNKSQQATKKGKKVTAEIPDHHSWDITMGIDGREKTLAEASSSDEGLNKPVKRHRRKASSLPGPGMKVTKVRSRRKADVLEEQSMESGFDDAKDSKASKTQQVEKDDKVQLSDQDISFTYSWPPLVCCFGAAKHLFIPSGRPANRLIDHEIHESMKDMFWTPAKLVRAPGGSPSSVAIAHASIGGRVAFMGKLGDDEYGEIILYHLNVNNVQTRAIKIDSSRHTGLSYMKLSKRGGLRASSVKTCAEDSFLSSEINIDVLKEAKMFYFSSSSLLDQTMRSTTMEAIKIFKKFGGVIFFDLNLPLPLWKSSRETNLFIQEAWKFADFIEVTKQEFEFLCGIEPMETFDTKDNAKSKFIHHKEEVVKQMWHDNLKVLFLTNGTSKVHYYTLKNNGFVRGMEDAPITPFTGDMSVSGDAMVAALMKMLTVQPHLVTNKGYLEHMLKYAINCGIIDQWSLARILGFPPKEGAELSPKAGSRWMSISEKEYRTVEEALA